MDTTIQRVGFLKQRIIETERQLQKLKDQLASVEAEREEGQNDINASPVTSEKWPLGSEEYKRYGRQMIVPNIGIQGGCLDLHLCDKY
jgi:adenylyltransferase and sulfurtransferase